LEILKPTDHKECDPKVPNEPPFLIDVELLTTTVNVNLDTLPEIIGISASPPKKYNDYPTDECAKFRRKEIGTSQKEGSAE
jgi:hypothetical protein